MGYDSVWRRWKCLVYRIFSIKRPGVKFKLGLVDRRLFEFAFYSGLLLLKKSFYAFFLTAVHLAFIPLVYYTTNKRWGRCIYNFPSNSTPGVFSGPGVKSRKYGIHHFHIDHNGPCSLPLPPPPPLPQKKRVNRYTFPRESCLVKN